MSASKRTLLASDADREFGKSSARPQRAAADTHQAHCIERATHGFGVSPHLSDGFRLEGQLRKSLLMGLALLAEGRRRLERALASAREMPFASPASRLVSSNCILIVNYRRRTKLDSGPRNVGKVSDI